MSSDIEDFRGLLNRIKEGDDTAAWELVEHYGEDIRNAVRRSLNRRLRPKFDSLDFVQLVWSSFFRRIPIRDNLPLPRNWYPIWSLWQGTKWEWRRVGV